MNNIQNLILIVAFGFALAITGCDNKQNSDSNTVAYTSLKEIPGVTKEEIEAVEELRKKYDSFTFGALASTEAFYSGGEIRGYAALLCEWLTELFGIKFVPKLYEWGDIFPELKADFTSELTATEERKTKLGFLFTDAIAERSTKYFRIAGSRPRSEIIKARPLKLVFLEGTTTSKAAISKLEETSVPHEAFYVNDFKSAYGMLKNSEADAFIHEMIVEAAFDAMGDVVVEDFFPLIYEPVSFTAQNPEFEPIINIMQKIIRNGISSHLTDLYEQGMTEYMRHKLFLQFDEKELAYLREVKNVAYLAEFDNYPLSFYNENESEWQGIAFDILSKITALTGLTFKPVNKPDVNFSDLVKMLENGEGAMISELVHTNERKGLFIWPEKETLRDNYVAISNDKMPDISLNRIMQLKVGVQTGTAYADLFNTWFPNHPHVVEYNDIYAAFKGLENGEVDILMFTMRHILNVTHYQEKPDFKVNMVFDYTFGSQFGFNKNEEILSSIVSKAMGVIDKEAISAQWLRKTFDYRTKFRPWLISVIALLIVIIILITFLFVRTKEKAQSISELQDALLKTMAEMVECRDDITGEHVERTRQGVEILLDEIEKSDLFQEETKDWNKKLLLRSCQLHDVGKVSIADSILKKPGKLTAEEFREMQNHTTFGERIIEKIESLSSKSNFLKYAKIFAISHHEKWNGKGYPNGLRENEIPLLGRIMAIADVYDALTSVRPYKEAFSHEEAVRIINEGNGTQFDPVLIEIFNRVKGKFYYILHS